MLPVHENKFLKILKFLDFKYFLLTLKYKLF